MRKEAREAEAVMRGFRSHLEAKRLTDAQIASAMEAANEFDAYLSASGASIQDASLDLLARYVSGLIENGRNSELNLEAIAYYCRFAGRNDLFIHVAGLVNARDVLPRLRDRLGELEGKELEASVFEGFTLPQLGAAQEAYAPLTKRVVQRMQDELSSQRCREVLTWNYHMIPAAVFTEKKERFERAGSIDEFLEDEHRRLVDELSRCANEGRPWYEQEITPEVVEFVRANQEICTGKRTGDEILITKIPYAPDQYLRERDPRRRRYLACHCPLARTAILESEGVPSVFCHCSAGFQKLPYDVIFEQSVEVEVLESVLRGDPRCRFAVRIPRSAMK